MAQTTPQTTEILSIHPRTRLFILVALLAGLSAIFWMPPVRAQASKGGGTEGMFITVPNPITEAVITQVKTKIQRAIEREGRQVRKIVFDFNPKGVPAATSDYGPCITLKNYLLNLRLGRMGSASYPLIDTIAFVHGEVSKHTILPVLACTELIMSPDAKIGDGLRGHEGPVPPEVEAAYRALAETHHTRRDLILKMLHRDLVVRKVRINRVDHYWDEATITAKREKGELPAGDWPIVPEVMCSAALARASGLSKDTLTTREEVARACQLSRQSMNEDWLVGRTPVPYRIVLTGNLDDAVRSLKRRISSAVHRDANVLVLQLECDGGSTADMGSYARYLRELTDAGGILPIKTIAYVPPKHALGVAIFLALGCSEIVMGSSATLGDFEYLKNRSDDNLAEPRTMLVELAKEQGYRPRLFEATLKRDLVLYGVRSVEHPQVHRLLTEQENQKQEDLPRERRQWVDAHRLPANPGEFLKIDAQLAREWGVALHTDVDSRAELNAKYQDYHLEKMRDVPDDWLAQIAEFFREPVVKILLIMVGIACLILALKSQGTGLPEVIAALCFVLFFWAHSFVGQYTMLAVLLFVLGLILLGVEVFVTPGIGVTAISGILLVVGSLVLVTLEKMPESTQDWINLGTTLSTFAFSLVGAVVTAFTVAWYLPSIPYANRLLLQPPTDDESGAAVDAGSGVQVLASLLGAIGEAATPLRPAGKARFDDAFLDVISEGDYINPGTRIQVIEIEGNRIVVKEV